MSSYGDRVAVVRSDDDLAAAGKIIDGHVAHLSRRQVKVMFLKHRPARARRFQHDLPREDVARDREPARCLPDLDSDMREMEVALARTQVCQSWPAKFACRNSSQTRIGPSSTVSRTGVTKQHEDPSHAGEGWGRHAGDGTGDHG